MSTALLRDLSFVVVYTTDMSAAHAFYVDTLGMTAEAESPAFLQLAAPDGKGATLGVQLAGPDSPANGASPEIWWVVDDVDALHQRLTHKGVAITQPPTDMPFGRILAFAGPDGLVLHAFKPRG